MAVLEVFSPMCAAEQVVLVKTKSNGSSPEAKYCNGKIVLGTGLKVFFVNSQTNHNTFVTPQKEVLSILIIEITAKENECKIMSSGWSQDRFFCPIP